MKGSGGGPGGTGDLEAKMSHGLVGNSGVIRNCCESKEVRFQGEEFS